MSAGSVTDPATSATPARTCEWCDSPLPHDGRAVCTNCGRLASRLAAMEPAEAERDEAPAAAPEPEPAPPPPPPAPAAVAPPPPPPPPPAPAPPAPAPPAPVAAPAPPAPTPVADGPVAPGGRWPTPAPLPPEEESRPWWRLAIPAALVVVLLLVGAAVVFSGGGDGGPEPSAAPSGGSVDISDLDDPTTAPKATTTEPEATTTTEFGTTADGRRVVTTESGIEWAMAEAPEVTDIVSDESPDPIGQSWQAQADKTTTEVVEVTQFEGEAFDADAAIEAITKPFGPELSAIEQSHIEDAPGRTASFTGTLDGEPVVGYVVAAQFGDEGIVAMTFREGDDLDGLYLDFLALPSTFRLT